MAPLGPDQLEVLPVVDEGTVVYRVVRVGDPKAQAFLDSFKSSHERGVPPRPRSPEERFRIVHMGISCFLTARSAAKVGERWGLGTHVAELRLPPNDGFSLARWGSPGHVTVWAEPVKLVRAVVDIVSIEDALRR